MVVVYHKCALLSSFFTPPPTTAAGENINFLIEQMLHEGTKSQWDTDTRGQSQRRETGTGNRVWLDCSPDSSNQVERVANARNGHVTRSLRAHPWVVSVSQGFCLRGERQKHAGAQVPRVPMWYSRRCHRHESPRNLLQGQSRQRHLRGVETCSEIQVFETNDRNQCEMGWLRGSGAGLGGATGSCLWMQPYAPSWPRYCSCAACRSHLLCRCKRGEKFYMCEILYMLVHLSHEQSCSLTLINYAINLVSVAAAQSLGRVHSQDCCSAAMTIQSHQFKLWLSLSFIALHIRVNFFKFYAFHASNTAVKIRLYIYTINPWYIYTN